MRISLVWFGLMNIIGAQPLQLWTTQFFATTQNMHMTNSTNSQGNMSKNLSSMGGGGGWGKTKLIYIFFLFCTFSSVHHTVASGTLLRWQSPVAGWSRGWTVTTRAHSLWSLFYSASANTVIRTIFSPDNGQYSWLEHGLQDGSSSWLWGQIITFSQARSKHLTHRHMSDTGVIVSGQNLFSITEYWPW